MATINEFRQELWDLKRYGLRSGGLIVLSEDNLKRLLRDFDDALDLDPSMFEDQLDNDSDNSNRQEVSKATPKSDEDITDVDLSSPKLNDESLAAALGLHNGSNNSDENLEDAIRPTHQSTSVFDVNGSGDNDDEDAEDDNIDGRSYTISSTSTFPSKPESNTTTSTKLETDDTNKSSESGSASNVTSTNDAPNTASNAGDVFNQTLNSGFSELDSEEDSQDATNSDSNGDSPFDAVATSDGIENSGVDSVTSSDIRPTASTSNPSANDNLDESTHSNDSSEPDADSLASLKVEASDGSGSNQFDLDGLLSNSNNQ